MLSIGGRRTVAIGVTLLLASSASRAAAQAPGSQRPYRALFGGTSDANARHRLNANTSLTQSYDGDVPVEAQGTVGNLEAIGHSTMLASGGDYAYNGRHLQVNATGAFAQRYYAMLGETRTVSSAAVIGVSTTLPGAVTVTAGQTAARTPLYVADLFPRLQTTAPVAGIAPIEALPSSTQYDVRGAESYSYGSTMTVTYNGFGRNSLIATGERVRTESPGAAANLRTMTLYSMRGQYVQRVGRNTEVTTTYRYGTSDFPSLATTGARVTGEQHDVEIGAYHRLPLSARRAFTFDGNVGVAVLVLPAPIRAFTVRPEPYRLIGDVAAGYQFLRTWQARGSYRRSVDYVAGLTEPVGTVAFTAAVDGSPTRSLTLFASAGFSNGEGTWTPSAVRFDTYTGDVRVRHDLTRMISVYAEYIYAFYELRGTILLGPALPPRFERNSARAGLTFNVPVLSR